MRFGSFKIRFFTITGSGNANHPAVLTLSARVPNAELLHALTRLAENDKPHILASDSSAGKFIIVNVRTGQVTFDPGTPPY